MRITQTTLKEYMAIEEKIQQLTRRKNEIRENLIKLGSHQFTNFTLSIESRTRECAIALVEIREILGDKLADKISHTIKFKQVKVSRI